MPNATPDALGRLILNRKSDLGLSYAELGRRGGIPGNTISALVQRGAHKQPPRPDTLRGLARALDVPLDVVRQKAAEAAGFTITDIDTVMPETGTRVRIIAAHMDEMSPGDQEILVQMATTFAKQRRAERAAGAKTKKPPRKRSSG